MAQEIRVSEFFRPVAEMERTLAYALKAFPPLAILYAPIQYGYEKARDDLRAKGYTVPDQIPTPAELAYYTALNIERRRAPPLPVPGLPLPFPGFSPEQSPPPGFQDVISPLTGGAQEQKKERQTAKMIQAVVV